MHELRKRFDVSINTIGTALDILASAGLVDKRRGSVSVRRSASTLNLGRML